MHSPALTAVIDPTAPTQHLYFGVTNHLPVSATSAQADFVLEVGADVELEAVTSDASPIRFDLWMVHHDGHVERLNDFDESSGFILTEIDDQTGDVRYLVRFAPCASPRDVVLHLDCLRADGRCADGLQPGEPCLSNAGCAEGLVCGRSTPACDSSVEGGTCVIPGAVAACAAEAASVVCGCDGVTYDSPCLAMASGAGVRAEGPCATPFDGAVRRGVGWQTGERAGSGPGGPDPAP